MNKLLKYPIIATGLAMFSMFFGAGNITFPLVLGKTAGVMNSYATIGLFITAIIIPFLGLLAVILFDGDYRQFFYRMGKIPGSICIYLVMIILGPFAVIPRTITLSFSVFDYSGLNNLPFWAFNAISCAIIFFCAFHRSRIVSILGYFLSPILVLLLGFIILKGMFGAPPIEGGMSSPIEAFTLGLKEGYNTLDLLAAFCFSGIVLTSLRMDPNADSKSILRRALGGSFVAGAILALIYVSMSFVSAHHSQHFAGLENDQILAALSFLVLGEHAGLIASLTTALTCLTTAITLAAVFASFIHDQVFQKKLSYKMCLFITVLLCFAVSFLRFNGISQIVIPVAFICYPTFIVLSIMNILNKLWGIKMIKTPVYITLAGTIFIKLMM